MTAPGSIYDGLLRAKQDGLIGHICASIHTDSADLKEIADDGKAEVILLGYNALNFTHRLDGIQACHDAGVGTIIMNPLSGGLIPQLGDQFGFLKRDPKESIAHAALRFVIGTPGVSAALPGIADIPMLEDCVAALDGGVPTLTEEDFTQIGSHLKSEFNTLCTSCSYCDRCPAEVPIVPLLGSYNQYLLGGTPKDVFTIYLIGRTPEDEFTGELDWTKPAKDAAKCTACGLCEPLCTQKLPIVERLREIASWTVE